MRSLKAEIEGERGRSYWGTVSLPVELGERRQIAIKIVDGRGIESVNVIEVKI